MTKPVYYEEVQFVRFGDGTRSGPTITLRLTDAKALDLFRGAEGQRYMMALAEITDTPEDAKPPEDAQPPAPPAPKGGRWAREAGIMCQDRAFQRQVERDYPHEWEAAMTNNEEDPAKAAAAVLRVECRIESRAQLDHDSDALERFRRRFYLPWASAESGITT